MNADTGYARLNTICLMIIAAIGVTSALIYTKPVLLPFAVSLFIYAVISPGIRYLQTRAKLSKLTSIIVAIFLFLMLSGFVTYFVTNSIEGFIQSAGTYQDKVLAFTQWLSEMLGKVGVQWNDATLRETIQNLPIFSTAQNITGGLFGFIGQLFLVMIFILFLILGHSDSVKNGGSGEIQNPVAREIFGQISRYAATKFLTSISTGVIVAVVLGICGVELAFMFGVLTFLLNFIPNIGSIIAVALPLPVVLLEFGFGWQFYVVLIFTGITQFLIGNVLEPKLMGQNLDLHPIAILIFLMFWGLVWGIPGMFLAVPFTAILKLVLARLEPTRGLSELLAGRLPTN